MVRITDQCLILLRATLLATLFISLALAVQAQQKQVRGSVKDPAGKAVQGATVTIKGTANSRSTTDEGIFTIEAKEGDMLVITAVSFEPTEVKITAATDYAVILPPSSTTMSDVVVVGYGRSSRKSLTSAITTVKPEDLNRSVTGDVGQLLQGKVAGLNVTASGDPNKPAAVILRGASTVNSPGAPFYVIDGIPVQISLRLRRMILPPLTF